MEIDRPNRNPHLLYPPFWAMVEAALEECWRKKIMGYMFEGYRSFRRQNYLWQQGRLNGRPGPVVTWLQGGESDHQWGLAFDLVFDGAPRDGIQWNWEGDYVDARKGDYERAAKIMKAHGLSWLGDRNIEMAHFYCHFGIDRARLKSVYNVHGTLGVWDLIDTERKEP